MRMFKHGPEAEAAVRTGAEESMQVSGGRRLYVISECLPGAHGHGRE